MLPEEDIVRAFRVFDPQKTGIIDPGVLEEHLMNEGKSSFIL